MEETKQRQQELLATLLEEKLIDTETLEGLRAEIKKDSSLPELILDQKIVSETVLLRIFSKMYQLPIVDISRSDLDSSLLKELPLELCRKHKFLPLGKEGNVVLLAIFDPGDIMAMNHLKFYLRSKIELVVAPFSQLVSYLNTVEVEEAKTVVPDTANEEAFLSQISKILDEALDRLFHRIEISENENSELLVQLHQKDGKVLKNLITESNFDYFIQALKVISKIKGAKGTFSFEDRRQKVHNFELFFVKELDSEKAFILPKKELKRPEKIAQCPSLFQSIPISKSDRASLENALLGSHPSLIVLIGEWFFQAERRMLLESELSDIGVELYSESSGLSFDSIVLKSEKNKTVFLSNAKDVFSLFKQQRDCWDNFFKSKQIVKIFLSAKEVLLNASCCSVRDDKLREAFLLNLGFSSKHLERYWPFKSSGCEKCSFGERKAFKLFAEYIMLEEDDLSLKSSLTKRASLQCHFKKTQSFSSARLQLMKGVLKGDFPVEVLL